MRSREELLASIQPDMRLTMDFMKRIYGYELTWPGFAEVALTKLEAAGCSKAREYYTAYVQSYEAWYAEEMKGVAEWLRKQQPDRRKPASQQQSNNEKLLNILKQLVGRA